MQFLMQCLEQFSGAHGLVLALFLGGLAGGFTHCVGMCAPFVLAQTNPDDAGSTVLTRLSSSMLLSYHFGRMVTYVFLAVLFHSVLNLAFLYSGAKIVISAFVLTLAATLFLASIVPLIGNAFPWLSPMNLGLPVTMISRHAAPLFHTRGIFKRVTLGMMLGFMPCGLVMAAIMAASTAPDIGMAALSMAAFALGTTPALIIVSLGGRAVLTKFPAWGNKMRGAAMAFSSLWLFILAGMMMI